MNFQIHNYLTFPFKVGTRVNSKRNKFCKNGIISSFNGINFFIVWESNIGWVITPGYLISECEII